jgi:hypothetical protein
MLFGNANGLLHQSRDRFLSTDTTPGSPTQSTVPTFRVVQQRKGQNVVMVLDKSGSMNSYDVSLKIYRAFFQVHLDFFLFETTLKT